MPFLRLCCPYLRVFSGIWEPFPHTFDGWVPPDDEKEAAMKAQGIFSRMDVLSSHYKEVEDHTSRPKLGEACPQDHASPPTIVVGCHDPFGQRCLKGRERSCRAKPHLRLRQKVFLCWLRKRCLSAWISASEHTICDELFPELTRLWRHPNLPTALALRSRFPTPSDLALASFALAACRAWANL